MKSASLIAIRPSTRLMVSLYLTAALALAAVLALQRFSVAPAALPIQRLQELPLQLGPWQGIEASLDQEIIVELQVDDWLLRSYKHASGNSIWLYVGYYARSFKPHSPLACFPGQGWKISQRGTQSISLLGMEPFLVHKLVVQKGLEQHLILYWNQSGEQVFTEMDPWQKRLPHILEDYWSRFAAILHRKVSRSDKVFVRVSAPIMRSSHDVLSYEIAFIQTIFPLLVNHFSLDVSSR
jgi:EpsI family protein